MIKKLSGAGLLALSFGVPVYADHHNEDITLYRVFVGDHQAGQVTAFNLNQPDKKWTFKTAGQVKLYPVAKGSAIAAIQSDDNQVNFIRSGISFHDHGEHSDIEITAPEAVSLSLKGERPFHLIEHDGSISINMNKGSYATIVDSHELSEGNVEYRIIMQNKAHHGVVVPWAKGWITSVAGDVVEEGKAPPRIGVQSLSKEGNPTSKLTQCTNLHGEAFSGKYLAFGCKSGVLVAKKSKGATTNYRMLTYPDNFPEGEMTGHLLGVKSYQAFLGSYGKNAVVVIDPTATPAFSLIELPFRRVDFILDPVRIQYGYVMTEDGRINQVNLINAEIEKSFQVTEPYSMDGHWNNPRPRLAVAGNELLVTDPNSGLIHRVNTETMEEIGSIEVDGVPYNIAVAGGSGMTH
ncbi:hypothetical protein [Marinomonas posidonica]|uniref:hypothetical protein n=1 Tax=Marinomonas posidonica TaxID=936476 RepID=UPI0037369AA8